MRASYGEENWESAPRTVRRTVEDLHAGIQATVYEALKNNKTGTSKVGAISKTQKSAKFLNL